jgi:hypothetical protein
MHGQLAHIVEKGRPAQLVTVRRRKSELLGDQIGQRPHPLGMATGESVVSAEGGRKGEDLLGRQCQVIADPVGGRLLDPAGQITGRAGLAGDGQTLRCPVGKDHRHLQQHGQGEETAGEAVGKEEHRDRDEKDVGPPHHLPPTPVCLGDQSGERRRRGYRDSNWGEEDKDANQGGENRKRLPPGVVGILFRTSGRHHGAPFDDWSTTNRS